VRLRSWRQRLAALQHALERNAAAFGAAVLAVPSSTAAQCHACLHRLLAHAVPAPLQESLKERLAALFDAYAAPLLRFVRKEVREACPTPEGNTAVSFMRLWASLAAPLMGASQQLQCVACVHVVHVCCAGCHLPHPSSLRALAGAEVMTIIASRLPVGLPVSACTHMHIDAHVCLRARALPSLVRRHPGAAAPDRTWQATGGGGCAVHVCPHLQRRLHRRGD